MKKIIFCVLLLPVSAAAWDGYDYDAGSHIEIERGNLVRPGQQIEYFDYNAGSYQNADVESVTRYGSAVEVEVYDYDSGEYRTFEMRD